MLEGHSLLFTALTILAVLIGGVVEIVPSLLIKQADAAADGLSAQQPYTALELEGRDIYLREGCYVCHSQMIRAFTWEKERYGEVSSLGDSRYDHPFQWGSKRTGPDLAREGGRRSDNWHWDHFRKPGRARYGLHHAPLRLDVPQTARPLPDGKQSSSDVGGWRAVTRSRKSAGRSEVQNNKPMRLGRALKQQRIHVEGRPETLALIAYIQRVGRALGTGK